MRVLFLIKPYIIDPLGIGYLSAVLKAAGHEVLLEHNDWAAEKVKLIKPDVVAFSVTTGQHNEYLADAADIKEATPEVKIVFGGSHPTYFPQPQPYVDYMVRGEAEKSFPVLLDNLDNSPVIIDPVELIQDLDSIPMPDRSLMYRFRKNHANPIKNVMSSRGCPFACPYCYNSVYKQLYRGQKLVRYHSVERVIAECEDVKDNHGAKFIFFADDEFAISERRLSEIAAQYKKRVGLPYHVQLRIDLLTEKKAKILKESGCRSATFAIESGDPGYRKKHLGRNISNEQIIEGSCILHEQGIAIRIENMVGLPGESIENAIATLDLNIRCKPELAWASLYQPYPGTILGDRCIAEGLFSGTVDDLKPSFFEDSVLPLENKKKFINLQRLFGVVASSPSLRRSLRLLLALPPNELFGWVYKWWKGNRYDRKLYTY